ncbi:MAG: APC family permease, partial [Anaerolineales bacterium]
IGAGVAGSAVVLAVALAAGVAAANALSSAQLAANHPVSGGTYEYGYRYLDPWLGFSAGWFFLLAKSASAATAALGFSGYTLDLVGVEDPSFAARVGLGLAAVALLTGVVLAGLRRSNITNIVIVSITLGTLAIFILAGLPDIDADNLTPIVGDDLSLAAFLQATALMFVAYTGYGRIATLGEEVKEPRRTIPRAIIATLLVTMTLYVAVAAVAVGTFGTGALELATETTAAPLEAAAAAFALSEVQYIVALGAITAMLGVLLNLILGLSRVLLAMGRRRDMPPIVARLNATETTPTVAVAVMGAVVAGLVLVGDVRLTWTFSAFNVLLYYGLTNLAALRLTDDERLFPRWISQVGLMACFFLAFWVPFSVWSIALVILFIGYAWRLVALRLFADKNRMNTSAD